MTKINGFIFIVLHNSIRMQTHTYKNGFRLVYQHLENPETSIQMYCDFGSIHEPADGRGAAHFIEHMCFKGTQRLRNTKELSTVFDKEPHVIMLVAQLPILQKK